MASAPPYVAYLALYPYQGDTSAKHLSFPAGTVVMAQPASQQGGWIWSSVQGGPGGGGVVQGWAPISYLTLHHMGQPAPPPSVPQSVDLFHVAEQQQAAQNPQGDDDWGFGGPIMGGEAVNTKNSSPQQSSDDGSKRGVLSGVGDSFRKAGSSVTGVAAKTGSVVTGTAKKTGFAMKGAARKTGLFARNSAKETKHRLQDISEQRSAKHQDQTVQAVPQQQQQVVYAAPTKQRSASDQCLANTGNGAARGAVVGAAWGLVTGRGVVRGAAVGGTIGGASGAVSNWKPCG